MGVGWATVNTADDIDAAVIAYDYTWNNYEMFGQGMFGFDRFRWMSLTMYDADGAYA